MFIIAASDVLDSPYYASRKHDLAIHVQVEFGTEFKLARR